MTDETFEIELITMANGGLALGHHNKRTVFIPYTIPGEIVEARITKATKRVDFAEGVRLIDASADREFPRCPHFGPNKCGRCHWQHMNYQAQLLIKQDVLADQLARIGGFEDADVRAVSPSPEQWTYNYHMLLKADSRGTLGFDGAGDNRLYPFEECHILHPDLLNLYETLDLNFTGMKRLRLQLGTDGNHMLILWIDDEDNMPQLTIDLPTSVNVILADNAPINLVGDSHSTYTINERDFRVTAGSDFRANVGQIPTLIDTVLDCLDLKDDYSVLDLYGGVGLLSAFIAPHVSLVTMVESFPPAATDADENLHDLENVDIIEGRVEDVLEAVDGSYDAAVLDPPSEGLSIDVVDMLGELRIPRLVYVSGDTATLARDAKRLLGHGYELQVVYPIDFAPQTYYITSVAVFTL